MVYKRHPISAAFPNLSAAERADLRTSIKALGILDPIVLYEEMILDGWQRYTVTRELGIDCPTVPFAGTRSAAVELALAKQVRRNMTKAERASVLVRLHAAELAPRGNRSKSASTADFVTMRELAVRAGIGERTIRRAKQLQERAIDSVRIVYEKGVISGEEAEQLAGKPREHQRMLLTSLLEKKRAKHKPFHLHGCVHIDGTYIPPTPARDLRLAMEVQENGIPALSTLVMSGKNIGLVAAAALSRRTASDQQAILASAPWVVSLRRLPRSRFERRQLKRSPYYFERG